MLAGLTAVSLRVHGNEPVEIEYTQFDCLEGAPFTANLHWDFSGQNVERIQVRLDKRDGRRFFTGDARDSAATGNWVRPGKRFVFFDPSSNAVLHEFEAPLPHECGISTDPVDLSEIEFRTQPPRLRYCGKPVERTQVDVIWDVSALGAQPVQILIGSSDGKLFSSGGPRGTVETGDWVTDRTRFQLYLPMRDEVIAEYLFRILPCSVSDHPSEPGLRRPDG